MDRRLLALGAAAAAAAVAACTRPRAAVHSDDLLSGWEARYAPAAGCVARVSPGVARPDSSEQALGVGALVVRVAQFDTTQPPVRDAQVFLVPLGVEAPKPIGPRPSADTGASRTFQGLAPGRYTLVVRRIGYWPRADTVTARAGAADTVDVAVDDSHAGYRNVHNCRPRRFRRAGESACVTGTPEAQLTLDAARYYATPQGRRTFHLPAGDTLPPPVVVRDEPLCERAGRAYGGPGSPPRRVVVVAIGGLFVVYDPYEPRAAGEFDVWMVFDAHWRLLRGMAA